MEEKERYEFGQRTLFDNREELTTFNDFNLDDFMQIICNLLNKQDKEIKYLQKLNTEIIMQNKNILKDAEIINQENQQLKQSQNQVAIDELEKFKNYIFTRIYLTANGDEEKINTYVDLKIKNLKGE